MTRRSLLLTLLLLTIQCGQVAFALSIEALPAWQGIVKNGAQSEVTVRVVADRGGSLELSLAAGDMTHRLRATVAPGEELTWRPVVRVRDDVMTLVARLNDEVAEQSVTFHRVQDRRPVVGVVALADLADQLPREFADLDARSVHLNGQQLPYHAASYSTLDLLVISPAGITDMQMQALQQFAAQCGRILFVGITPALRSALAAEAGCRGAYIESAEALTDTAQLNQLLAQLMARKPKPLPTDRSLAATLDADAGGPGFKNTVVFFAIYFAALLLALAAGNPFPYLIGTVTLATLVGTLSWSFAQVETEQLQWIEGYSGDKVFRMKTIQRLQSGGSGSTSVTAPGGYLPVPLNRINLDIEYAAADGTTTSTTSTYPAGLYSHQSFSMSGSTRASQPQVTLELIDGVPLVTNTGETEISNLLLAWDDSRYQIPALAAGSAWRPDGDPQGWQSDRIEQLFRKRALGADAALLAALPASDSRSRGYIMLVP